MADAKSTIRIEGDSSSLRSAVQSATRDLERFKTSTRSIASATSGAFSGLSVFAGGALAAGSVAFAAGLKSAAEQAGNLVDMSNRLGVSVETLSTLGSLAQQSGVDMDQLGNAINKMQRALVQAGDNQALQTTFDSLSLSVSKLRQLTPEQQFAAIGERLASIQDPAKRTAASVDVFGKSGAIMLQVFRDNQGVLEKNVALFESVSKVSTENALKLDTLGDSWTTLKINTSSFFTELGAIVAPALNDAVRMTSEAVSKIRQLMQQAAVPVANQSAVNRIDDAIVMAKADLEAAKGSLLQAQRTTQFTGGLIGKGAVESDIKRIDELKSHIADLSQQRDALAMGPAQKEGITPTVAPAISKGAVSPDLEGGTNRQAGATKKLSDAQKELNDLMREGQSITEKYLTPQESIAARQDKLSALFDAGAISLETYQRAMAGVAMSADQMGPSLESFTSHLQSLADEADSIKNKLDPFRGFEGEVGRLNEMVDRGLLSIADAQAEAGRAYEEAQKQIEGAASASKDANNVGQDFALTMSSAISGAITHWQGFGNLLKSLAQDVAQLIIKLTVLKPLENSISSVNWGSVGKGIGSLFGFADGGIMTAGGPIALKRYAGGGVARSPQMALFGEGSRPEAFVPLPDGRRIPVDFQGAGGGSTVQIIDQRSGGSREVQQSRGPDGSEMTRIIIRDELKAAMGSGYLDKALSTNYGVRRAGVTR